MSGAGTPERRMELRVLPDKAAVARAGAERLADLARSGGHVALAGGSSPRDAYMEAAALEPNWSAVTCWFSDERAVPPDDEHSNYLMAKRALVDRLELKPRVVRIPGELEPDAAAAGYEAELRSALGTGSSGIPTLHLCLLGLGPDSHCASLFPGKPAVQEKSRLVAGVPEPGMAPHVPRVTFTLPLINHAAEIMFLVSGADKAEAVRRAFGPAPDPESPAAHVVPAQRRGRLVVLLDEAAAAQL